MSTSPIKVAAFEDFDSVSAEYSAGSSSLNQPNSGLTSPLIHSSTNTQKAIETQEKKANENIGILSNLRPKLEKIRAVKPDEISAASLKSNFRKIAKHTQMANKLMEETNKNFCEWASKFESEEVSRLSFEFSKYMQLNYNMNAMISDRFDHIAFRLKTISKQESRRDEFIVKHLKAKRELEVFKKRSTDINVTSTIYDKLKFSSASLNSAQNLLEQTVRSSLRPAMFGYVYALNKYSLFIDDLANITTLDIDSFERKLEQHDSILREQLNISDSKYLKKPCFDIAQKYELEFKDKIAKSIYDAEHSKSNLLLNSALAVTKPKIIESDEESDDEFSSEDDIASNEENQDSTFKQKEPFHQTLATTPMLNNRGQIKKKKNGEINTSENHTLKERKDSKSNIKKQ